MQMILTEPLILIVFPGNLNYFIGQKKASSHSLVFTWDTRNKNRDRVGEEGTDQTHLISIWTMGAMDKTSAQPQVKLSLLRSISLKIRPHNERKLSLRVYRRKIATQKSIAEQFFVLKSNYSIAN